MTPSELFAKSHPPESIQEHTQNVLEAYEYLCDNGYLDAQIIKKYDQVFRIVILMHDLGKLYTVFQNQIRQSLKIPPLNTEHLPNIRPLRHEWLSPAFLGKPIRQKLRAYNKENINMVKLVQYVICYHHNREEDQELLDYYLADIIKQDLEERKHLLNIDYPLSHTFSVSDIRQKIENNYEHYFKLLVLLKGVLHKCDYAASAHIEAECCPEFRKQYRHVFYTWVNKNFKSGLKPFQEKANLFSEKSLLLTASTGMGKTEFSMNWLNGKKGFYLLGIRIAVNEMYKRFVKIFKPQNVGLLHGESSLQMLDASMNSDDYREKLTKTRQMSYPLMIATADQLILSVFKYRGYELHYLTASYSQIVVDEIQSFSPEALAAIIVFLKDIHHLGGRFLVMTATLPPFVIKELTSLKDVIHLPDELSPKKRHYIQTHNISIMNERAEGLIRKSYKKNRKILIICNTISQAQKMFLQLMDLSPRLLHSNFIRLDRAKKEKNIMDESKDREGEALIWITTQLIEASLDIDFDILFTECSTVDSMFQRFGRCWRNRQEDYTAKFPNIHIFKVNSNNIYDTILLDRSWQILQKYSNGMITEQNKQTIIQEVFNNIEQTSYGTRYYEMKELLERGYRADNRTRARKIFRSIVDNYLVIPEPVFNTHKADILSWIMTLDSRKISGKELLLIRKKIMNYTVSLQLKGKRTGLLRPLVNSSDFCSKYNLHLLKGVTYNSDQGIIFIKGYTPDDNFI